MVMPCLESQMTRKIMKVGDLVRVKRFMEETTLMAVIKEYSPEETGNEWWYEVVGVLPTGKGRYSLGEDDILSEEELELISESR